jgi:hypothetical protein
MLAPDCAPIPIAKIDAVSTVVLEMLNVSANDVSPPPTSMPPLIVNEVPVVNTTPPFVTASELTLGVTVCAFHTI